MSQVTYNVRKQQDYMITKVKKKVFLRTIIEELMQIYVKKKKKEKKKNQYWI